MKKPKLPKKLTEKSVREYKAQLRRWDKWRIEQGISTPEEINRENSIFPYPFNMTIIKFPDF